MESIGKGSTVAARGLIWGNEEAREFSEGEGAWPPLTARHLPLLPLRLLELRDDPRLFDLAPAAGEFPRLRGVVPERAFAHSTSAFDA